MPLLSVRSACRIRAESLCGGKQTRLYLQTVACLQYFCDMAASDGSRVCVESIQKAIERTMNPSSELIDSGIGVQPKHRSGCGSRSAVPLWDSFPISMPAPWGSEGLAIKNRTLYEPDLTSSGAQRLHRSRLARTVGGFVPAKGHGRRFVCRGAIDT
jgi:hypothetical protein